MADRDILAGFSPRERRDLQAICAAHQIPAEALVTEMAAAYLRLVREVPGALPRSPMAPIYAAARRGSGT